MRYYCPDGRLTAAYRSAGKYTSSSVNDITYGLCISRLTAAYRSTGKYTSSLVNDITHGLCVIIVRMLDSQLPIGQLVSIHLL